MDKWINMVENFCTDLSREKEFNNWYDSIHMLDYLKTPGVIAAKRYVIKEPCNGRGTHLAIYEIETDDIDKTMAVRHEYREKEQEQGRSHTTVIPNLVLPVWRNVLFKQISERTRGQ